MADILDELPLGETFDWVGRVSINLATQMLATLFDFPFEQRHKLTYWSDIAVGTPEIAGGNDTTRNSASDGVVALNQNPAEYDKLRASPGLIPSMVSEIIRWQTPLAHMRRTATQCC